VVKELPGDSTLSMEVLVEIRGNTETIIGLLLEEEDDGQEEEADG
jgi:hypothetical protein